MNDLHPNGRHTLPTAPPTSPAHSPQLPPTQDNARRKASQNSYHPIFPTPVFTRQISFITPCHNTFPPQLIDSFALLDYILSNQSLIDQITSIAHTFNQLFLNLGIIQQPSTGAHCSHGKLYTYSNSNIEVNLQTDNPVQLPVNAFLKTLQGDSLKNLSVRLFFEPNSPVRLFISYKNSGEYFVTGFHFHSDHNVTFSIGSSSTSNDDNNPFPKTSKITYPFTPLFDRELFFYSQGPNLAQFIPGFKIEAHTLTLNLFHLSKEAQTQYFQALYNQLPPDQQDDFGRHIQNLHEALQHGQFKSANWERIFLYNMLKSCGVDLSQPLFQLN